MTITVLHIVLLTIIVLLLLILVYIKGLHDGKIKEFEKIYIQCTPTVTKESAFFKSKHIVGYEMQFFYNGIPLGEPIKRTIESREDLNEKNIDTVIQIVKKSVDTLHFLVTKRNVPISVSDKAKTITKKKEEKNA